MMLATFDRLLNRVTMYRFLVYCLCVLSGAGFILSALGFLSLSVLGLALSLIVLVTVCLTTNKIFASIWGVGNNVESTLITALILFCIMPPITNMSRLIIVSLAGLFAISSKYLLAVHGRHIFNPSAAGAALLGLIGLASASWWVGSKEMLPITLLVGLLITRKIRKFHLVLPAIAAAVSVMLLREGLNGDLLMPTLTGAFTSWPLIFFVTIMLTEPATMPSRRNLQILYAVTVSALFASSLHFGSFYTTPQNVLVLGNLCAFLLSPRYKVLLTLKKKIRITPTSYHFVFSKPRNFKYLAGQYMEWTLPHKNMDSRGARRAFTLASSPTEDTLSIGVKFYEPSSSYKNALVSLRPGQTITASQLGGDFVLPKQSKQKLVFIAGGIGITPFRSMCQYLIDSKITRDITLFYIVKSKEEIAYEDVFEQAKNCGVKTISITTPLTATTINKNVPNANTAIFYISGPDGMVKTYKEMLLNNGIKRKHIKTDYFSGY